MKKMEKLCVFENEMTKDETGCIEIVLFSSLVDEVSNNTSYDFKKMRVQKVMNHHILKSTETNKTFSYEKTVKAKVVSIDLKTLTQTYLCTICSIPVSINNAVAWCEICDNASSQS